MSLLSQELLPKNLFRKNDIFRESKSLILGQIWPNVSERALKELLNALFGGVVALLVPD